MMPRLLWQPGLFVFEVIALTLWVRTQNLRTYFVSNLSEAELMQ